MKKEWKTKKDQSPLKEASEAAIKRAVEKGLPIAPLPALDSRSDDYCFYPPTYYITPFHIAYY